MTYNELADHIEALLAKATPGDWDNTDGSIGVYVDPRRDWSDVASVATAMGARGLLPGEGEANAALIVLLRNNAKRFITALRSDPDAR